MYIGVVIISKLHYRYPHHVLLLVLPLLRLLPFHDGSLLHHHDYFHFHHLRGFQCFLLRDHHLVHHWHVHVSSSHYRHRRHPDRRSRSQEHP
ncbi:hypothetical protein BJV82DRAFT_617592 [Fennellomyces sp. T-0311]|nr:hypothetical protein BJV82DRAFT_617592 [Fennellomyces sp. T-0311]